MFSYLQFQSTLEKVTRIVRGGNSGWPRYEGTLDYRKDVNLTFPINYQGPSFEYAHLGKTIENIPSYGVAVIGGHVYRAKGKNKCLQVKINVQ